MSNICLKVTIEKKWDSQNFDFISSKVLLQVSFWRAPTHADINQFSIFFFVSISQGIITFYSQRVYAFMLNKNINFNKNETESKMENPTHSFREIPLALQLV